MNLDDGFIPKRAVDSRLPPGQYKTDDFPVLSLGPTPHVSLADWRFEVSGMVTTPLSWTWDEFTKLPVTQITSDIHCVTKWSKFDTSWSGVSMDEIIAMAQPASSVVSITASSFDGYTTNVPLADLINDKAMIATAYNAQPITPEHGGPARLLIPHLYFWKSAKWIKSIHFSDRDVPGFWEVRGYHNYGDPWKEQRYWNDP
jgi:DMSO/TMAO reductase YedYZ molybdopterin-dependent catalytic subunit